MAELVQGRKSRALAKADVLPDSMLEFQSPTAALISLPVPGSARHVTITIVSMVVASIVLAGTIPIDRVVTTPGKLVPQAATLVVQPLETSIVRSIDVHEGQTVKAGDLLARLDPTFAAADAGSLAEQVKSLQAEVDRLTAEAAGRPYIAQNMSDPAQALQAAIYGQRHAERTFKLENYQQKMNSLESQIAGNLSAANYFRQRLNVAQNVEAMRKELEHLQVGSKLNTLSSEDNRIEMERNLNSAQGQANTEARDLQALMAERDGEEQDWRTKISQDLTDQGRKLDDAKQQLKKAALRKQLVELRAPQDSTVLSVSRVSEGSVMQSGDQFITLVPVDAPLEIETYISGKDSGFVHVGDPVVVKFDTFPFTQYGAANGTVRQISADSFTQQNMISQIGDPGRQNPAHDSGIDTVLYYKGTVSLDEVKLHNTPPGFKLVPGMPITADIKIGKRTVLTYLLARAIPTITEGMREP
jgi:HlyD family secretion protein